MRNYYKLSISLPINNINSDLLHIFKAIFKLRQDQGAISPLFTAFLQRFLIKRLKTGIVNEPTLPIPHLDNPFDNEIVLLLNFLEFYLPVRFPRPHIDRVIVLLVLSQDCKLALPSANLAQSFH